MPQLIILVHVVFWLAVAAGCTCGGYKEHSNIGKDVTNKQIFYCSSKDVSGLKIKHGDTILELDKSDNEVGKVLEKIVDKVPLL